MAFLPARIDDAPGGASAPSFFERRHSGLSIKFRERDEALSA
jgi:hypothetical protein